MGEARRIGALGEEAACGWFRDRGYEILARNFRSRRGEIDIVARKSDTIVFIEVKHWPSGSLEGLEYAVNASKRRRIVETSKYFLLANRQYNCPAVRYDVLFIPEMRGDFHHLEAAFTE